MLQWIGARACAGLVMATVCGCVGLVQDEPPDEPATDLGGGEMAETRDGTLQLVVVGGADDTPSHPEYFLEDAAGQWLRLLFDRRPDILHRHQQDGDADGHLHLKADLRVRVRGVRQGEALQVLALGDLARDRPAVERVQSPLVAPSPKKVAVILANFSNDTSQPHTLDSARALVFTGSSSTNAYFKEVSFGVRSLVGKVRADGDVFGWYTLAAGNSPCDYSGWGSAARAAAQAAGVDLTGYDQIVHYFARSSACGWSGVGQVPGRYTWINGSSARTIAHELGHNYGLHHASSLSCTTGGTRVPISASCTSSEYGDPFDVMGGGYRHLNAFHKARLGWLEAVNMATAGVGTTTWTVAPIATKSSGIQSLRVPIGTTGNYYYIEHRQPFGFDNFAATSSVVNGVLIHRASEYTVLQRPQLIDLTSGTTTFTDAALTVGNAFVDAAGSVSIKVLSRSAAGAVVEVTR